MAGRGQTRGCLQPPWWLGLLLVGLFSLWIGVTSQEGGDYGRSPFDWVQFDTFDEITERYSAINKFNCRSKPERELYMPDNTISQVPKFNKLLSSIIYPNRTNLLHLHNMALNRAFFFSYIYQKLNESENFPYQPGLMYYYFSSAADISANEYAINGSMIMFDHNASYPNWYRNLAFNKTLPLFGPGAFRLDDFNDPTNWLREPTNHTIDIYDFGAGPQSNYTHESYKTNEWFNIWLPDGWDKEGQDSVMKHSYDVGIKYSNETGKFLRDEFEALTFFGPPSPGQNDREQPVIFTRPYFDCGKSNKWIVSAVAPIVDWIPRYLEQWLHIRRHRFVAVSVQSIDFLSIDLNPCPLSFGNQIPNLFAGISRCKQSTTCEPLDGWGYRRGGYKCMCSPGYRAPQWNRGDFMGEDIESATEEEYKNGFDCLPVELRQVIPVIRGNESGTPTYNEVRRKRNAIKLTKLQSVKSVNQQIHEFKVEQEKLYERARRAAPSDEVLAARKEAREARIRKTRELLVEEEPKKIHIEPKIRNHFNPLNDLEKRKKRQIKPRYKRGAKSRKKRSMAFDEVAYERMQFILEHKDEVNRNNCLTYKKEELELPGDVSYGVDQQFSNQARTALRLAHFLSNFLQNIDRYEEYGNLRGDNLLNVELIFGEALANVMGDFKIKGSGVFYDIDKFEGPDGRTRQYFGPYAYRYDDDNPSGPSGGDRANTQFRAIDYAGFPQHYLDEPWFKNVKERWQSNTYGLTKFTEKTMIRSDLAGTSLKKFEMYPQYYHAPKEEDGWWSPPYFDCDGYVNDWVITYAVPFFGLNSIRSALEFKGVVMVDIKLDELSINQCPQDYYVPNAFKGTARCHYESTYCEYLPSRKFTKGAYKCNCRQGYEYPFQDRAWYFDGQTMEEEYRKLLAGETSRFHTLQCRIAGAAKPASTVLTLMIAILVTAISLL